MQKWGSQLLTQGSPSFPAWDYYKVKDTKSSDIKDVPLDIIVSAYEKYVREITKRTRRYLDLHPENDTLNSNTKITKTGWQCKEGGFIKPSFEWSSKSNKNALTAIFTRQCSGRTLIDADCYARFSEM